MKGLYSRFRSTDIGAEFTGLNIRCSSTLTTPHTVWPFALWAAFPPSDYYGHADSLQTHPRISGLFPTPYFRSR